MSPLLFTLFTLFYILYPALHSIEYLHTAYILYLIISLNNPKVVSVKDKMVFSSFHLIQTKPCSIVYVNQTNTFLSPAPLFSVKNYNILFFPSLLLIQKITSHFYVFLHEKAFFKPYIIS